MSKKLANISTKTLKSSALEAEWKVEGSSHLVVSPASLIMHIFNSQKTVSTNAILSPTTCQVQEETALFMGARQFVGRRVQ